LQKKHISPNFGIFSKINGNIVAECQLQYVFYNIISFGEFSHCGEILVDFEFFFNYKLEKKIALEMEKVVKLLKLNFKLVFKVFLN
jgi:hypothetical protein